MGLDDKAKLARIQNVIAGGTAEAGGIQAGDLIEAIDHVDVAPGTPLRKIIERLRGPEGTTVTLRLREEKSKTSRTGTFARLPVMIKSVEEVSRLLPPELTERLVPCRSSPSIQSITASTAQELRSWEGLAPSCGGAKAVILDLRNVGGNGAETDHAALPAAATGQPDRRAADLLGKVRDARINASIIEFRADRDCLFRDWPSWLFSSTNVTGGAGRVGCGGLAGRSS